MDAGFSRGDAIDGSFGVEAVGIEYISVLILTEVVLVGDDLLEKILKFRESHFGGDFSLKEGFVGVGV